MKIKKEKGGDALFNARLQAIREKRERERGPFPLPGGHLEQFRAKLKAAEEAEKRREAKALREEDARRAREEAEKEARDKVKAKRDALVKKLEQGRAGGVEKPPPKRAPPPKRKAPALVPSRRRIGGVFTQARDAVDATSP